MDPWSEDEDILVALSCHCGSMLKTVGIDTNAHIPLLALPVYRARSEHFPGTEDNAFKVSNFSNCSKLYKEE